MKKFYKIFASTFVNKTDLLFFLSAVITSSENNMFEIKLPFVVLKTNDYTGISHRLGSKNNQTNSFIF